MLATNKNESMSMLNYEIMFEFISNYVYKLSAYANEPRMGDKQKLEKLCKLIAEMNLALR